MGDVYSSANIVLAWLGEPADDSDRAMKFIATLYNKIKKYNLHKLDPVHERSYIYQFPSFKNENSPDWVAFRKLLMRLWFSCIWIIQEMVLSGNRVLAYGDEIALWDELAAVVHTITSRGLVHYLYIDPIAFGTV